MPLENKKVSWFRNGIIVLSFLRNRLLLLFWAISAIYFIYFTPSMSINHIKELVYISNIQSTRI